ncbi:XTP/dITP diphosphatase [Anoxynatronum buryatiense]|uniref:dITP/XTP pyrophosphatase n=1 Tax=Anoxynatronum buryatiense TaxID=489973 RepID=A0AA45WX85_9CLOT|nr:XTP/dITP diphosphatase [Anoxynatronum buryatiense]SMP62586.1 XTP/dITP diphosphohydrolase [Anoxynatronum buryatiense]
MKHLTAVIATGNPHKLEEIGTMLADFHITVRSMKDVGLAGMEIEETGTTFEENALIKARQVMAETGMLALADDSGLEVDALGGAPGVYSARYAGEGATDEANNQKLLEALTDVPMENRQGRFVCALAAVFPDGRELVVRGTVEGYIDFEPIGAHGFGYDPLFLIPAYQQTFGELGPVIKNSMSHRGKAIEVMKEKLVSLLAETP